MVLIPRQSLCVRVLLDQVQAGRSGAAGPSVRLSEAANRGAPAVPLLRHERPPVSRSEVRDVAAGAVHQVPTHDRPDR